MKWITRRAVFRMGGAGALGSGLVAYGWGPGRSLVVERVDCPLRGGHGHLDGLRIVVLSDFHHDDYGSASLIEEAVGASNAFDPHLVLMLGDYVSEDPGVMDLLVPLFRPLRAKLGVFGILGNHDHTYGPDEIVDRLQKGGIEIFRNRARQFTYGGGSFSVAGMESHWTGRPNWPGLQQALPEDQPVILCWHEPDTFVRTQKEPRLALQLSGHTHGGQICAPWGPLRLPRYGKRYVRGLFEESGTGLYVSRGLGVLDIPIRLFSPPEVTCITLKAGPAVAA